MAWDDTYRPCVKYRAVITGSFRITNQRRRLLKALRRCVSHNPLGSSEDGLSERAVNERLGTVSGTAIDQRHAVRRTDVRH